MSTPVVMVVDDTALARESVARLLEYEGFKTIKAANGKEGYAMLYTQTPDLILLDLMMPEMDGVTFLRMVRRSPQWENIPVIILTGVKDDDQLIARARELRIDDVIPKASFGFDDLLSRVRKAIPPLDTTVKV
ncbi:MAG: response regulator [Tepidisphaeraceae bacterium]|jgi:two-component system phosphate regulon response regulator PhoB